jgi:hypothetical protein
MVGRSDDFRLVEEVAAAYRLGVTAQRGASAVA